MNKGFYFEVRVTLTIYGHDPLKLGIFIFAKNLKRLFKYNRRQRKIAL